MVLRAYGDGNIFGEPYGQGPVRIIWLHGWARRGQDFAASATDLARRGVASVALDLPGFGASPTPDSPGGARRYAELVVPVLKAIGDGPFVLVGHSFGGTVDREVPLDVATRASALLAATHTLQSLHGIGHLVPTEAPGELANVVGALV